jgi:hypothetical protein
MNRTAKALFLTALLPLACSRPASADLDEMTTLTFQVRSEYPYQVCLEFYSQERSHGWPGGTQAYLLSDSKTHVYTINCRRGERISYGAWVRGNTNKYWGVGALRSHPCDSCAFVADGSVTPVIVLNP